MRGIITDLLQLPLNYVRPANQNAPAQGLEDRFMTVLIHSVTGEHGVETHSEIPDSGLLLYSIEGQHRATATIQAFGEGAFDLLLNLNALLDTEWGTWNWQQANFGLITRRGPTDQTMLVPALMWQRRAVMEVDFYFIVQAEAKVPYFSSFNWTIYVDEDGSAHYEVQVQ